MPETVRAASSVAPCSASSWKGLPLVRTADPEAPGTVTQVRASAQSLIRYAKTSGATVILVGHVTKDGAIVWEYMYPLFSGANSSNAVYRAYRLPYGWIPQITAPVERRITPPALGDFRVP